MFRYTLCQANVGNYGVKRHEYWHKHCKNSINTVYTMAMIRNIDGVMSMIIVNCVKQFQNNRVTWVACA